jgi:hypothetical protein
MRPLCPYPQLARYSGCIDEAANFASKPTPG